MESPTKRRESQDETPNKRRKEEGQEPPVPQPERPADEGEGARQRTNLMGALPNPVVRSGLLHELWLRKREATRPMQAWFDLHEGGAAPSGSSTVALPVGPDAATEASDQHASTELGANGQGAATASGSTKLPTQDGRPQ